MTDTMEIIPAKTPASEDEPLGTTANFVCPQPVKVCILGASFQKDNLAVSSLLTGTIMAILNAYPYIEISLLDGTAESGWKDVTHGAATTEVKCFRIDFSMKLSAENNMWSMLIGSLLSRLPRCRFIHDAFSTYHSGLRCIEEADIVFSLSGGDRFTDACGMNRFFSVALPQLLAILLRKPLVLLPQTLGPFKKGLTRIIARSILSQAKVVYSRDHENIEEIPKVLGVDPERFEFGYDMGFVVEPRIQVEQVPAWLQRWNTETPLVALNVSGLLYGSDSVKKSLCNLKSDYRQLIYDLIEHFVVTHRAEVVFIPYVFGATAKGECDVMAGRRIFRGVKHKLYEHLHFIDGAFDEYEMRALMGRCDFFIGSRVEACIAALSQGIPTTVLAYSQRSCAVFASAGLENVVLDMEALDEKAILEHVDHAYRHREELRAHLESKIPTFRASVMDLLKQISISRGVK